MAAYKTLRRFCARPIPSSPCTCYMSVITICKTSYMFSKIHVTCPRKYMLHIRNRIYVKNILAAEKHRGSTLVLSISGSLPADTDSIKLIYSVTSPTESDKSQTIVKEEFCQVKKKFFSSNFVMKFDNVGQYRLKIEYCLVDSDNTQWAVEHFRELVYKGMACYQFDFSP